MLAKLEQLDARREEVGVLLSDPDVFGDQNRFRALSIEYDQLRPVSEHFQDYQLEAGDFSFSLTPEHEEKIRETIRGLLSCGQDLHVYLTSHFMYGTHARIITLSAKKPLSIIYKEFGSMPIRLD